MKLNKGVLLLCFFLVSCGGEVSSSQSSSSLSSSSSSSEVQLTQLDYVVNLKKELEKFTDVVSKNTYSVEQEDYYGISINVSESGSKTLYQDNFIVEEFVQTIGDDSLNGKREIGLNKTIANGSRIYTISYFGENDSANKVTYYDDNEYNRKYVFDLGFVTDYVYNILDVTIAYHSLEGAKLTLDTNFDEVDLSSDGNKYLQYKFISYAENGRDKIEEVQRNDVIVIENGKIVSSSTEMLYSLQDGVNYQYMQKQCVYEYDNLATYENTKLNPKDFE